jgi:cold shock CspA family protein
LKALKDLTFGYSDAENYRRRENKDLFSQIFLRTEDLSELKAKNVFFLVGEKGTGKTAYAVYLSNSPDESMRCSHKFIRETDYEKFITLKTANHLTISDYVDVWKTILLLMIGGDISSEPDRYNRRIGGETLSNLRQAIDDYYNKAFSPEIVYGLQFIENLEFSSEIAAKYKLLSGGFRRTEGASVTEDRKNFQTTIGELIRSLQTAIASVKLNSDFVLFIDGIDIRPENVPYTQYLECVRGLANAAWHLNNDFFPGIKDSPGRVRIVLLLRPDIFNSLGLQNRNTKLKDNSVILDWRTNYNSYRSSNLFQMADKFLAAQQDSSPVLGKSWDHYFPFDAKSFNDVKDDPSSFVIFLRYSYHRPRDILAMLKTLEELYVRRDPIKKYFDYSDLISPAFRKAYGSYLLGEIKDALSFYYDEREYEAFLKFFEYLNGKYKFTYDDYLNAFSDFSSFFSDQGKSPPSFMTTPEELLQFLYDQNIICYIEFAEGAKDEKFIRWCFQERSPANISPKVQNNRDYEIHYGLSNALNTGKELKQRRQPKKLKSSLDSEGYFEGNLKKLVTERNYGFIHQDGIPVDIFFHISELRGQVQLRHGMKLRYRLDKAKDGRLVAVDITESKAH